MNRVPPESTASDDRTRLLLQRAQRGDEAARDALFTAAVPPVLAYVRVRLSEQLGRRVEPEDVLQEALAAALPALSEFEPRGPRAFVGWLCRIAEHQIKGAADHHGAKKRNPVGKNEPWSRIATRLVAVGTSPGSAAQRGEELARLEAALLRLPVDEREVMLGVHFEGRTVREIADATGRSATTTHRLLGRATARLGRELRQPSEQSPRGDA